MTANRLSTTAGFLLLGALAMSGPASSAVFDPGVGLGVEYTDNARLTPDNEEDDLILLGFVGGSLDASSGPLQARGIATLVYQDYTDNTFSDQYYWNADVSGGWEMMRNRVDWVARNRFTQRQVDALDANTPDNNQDTNIFSIGPNINLPITARNTLTLQPAYRNFYYETSNTDNEQYSLGANWAYDVSPTLQSGLIGSVIQTKYDDSDINPDTVSSTLQLAVSASKARSNYALAAGATHVNRDDFENQSGFSGSLSWLRSLTGVSSVRLFAATSLTDASNDALDTAFNPGRGNVDNVQVNGDVFRDYIGRVEYLRNKPSLNSRLWLELRDIDYKETPQDRDVIEIGLDVGRPVTSRMSTGLYAYFNRTDRSDDNRTDERYMLGGDLSYKLGAKLTALFNIQYQTRDSDDNAAEYDEVAGFVGLVYGFGNLARTRLNSLPE